ncbi:MAG: glycosyltransferase family 4 protein [Cyclobacteriaceae bacterium]
MPYLISTLFFFFAMLLFFRIARQFGINDRPNERSSHQETTIRGGGMVFTLAVMVAFFLGEVQWPLFLAVILVAVVSFVDDIRQLHQWPRFLAHFLAAFLILYAIGMGDLPFWWAPLLFLFLIGWVNIFNFMDGINGITVLYALVSLWSFYLIPAMEHDRELILLVGLSGLVFAFFNLRKKAITFAGDVGSIVMALLLGYLMLKAILLTQNPLYLVFFTVYALDGLVTLAIRLRKGENIFQPHRTHLYQYLVNEWGYGHQPVAVSYALIQLGINLFWIYGLGMDSFRWFPFLIFTGMALLVYGVVRWQVVQKAPQGEKK